MTKLLASFSRCGAVGALVAAALGCRGADASRESASTAAPVSLAGLRAGLPASPRLPGDDDPAPVPPAPLPGTAHESLGDRLAHEAASRPSGAPRVEQLIAALAARGVAVARTRQVLGATLDARYCAIAVTARGVVASVCEFDSAAEVAHAREHSERRFAAAMPNRRFVAHGDSLLIIANLSDAVEDEARTIAAAFAALPAVEK